MNHTRSHKLETTIGRQSLKGRTCCRCPRNKCVDRCGLPRSYSPCTQSAGDNCVQLQVIRDNYPTDMFERDKNRVSARLSSKCHETSPPLVGHGTVTAV